MEKVYLIKYPWVNGEVLMEFASNVVVKFTRGDCARLDRGDLGVGHILVGFEQGGDKFIAEWANWFRKKTTVEVKDEVVGFEVGEC